MFAYPLGLRLGAGFVLAGAIALASCTPPGLVGVEADGQAITGSTVQTPPLDEIKDDLGLGKEHYRAGSFGLAEKHFRLAIEKNAGSAEAWLGLAASYDKLRRYDLADRAYRRAYAITGPTPEFLNNRGYSYLLRGNLHKASIDLNEAIAKAPDDPRIQSNLDLLRRRAGGA
jgi:Flp pilus assembly protein TadD